jgi:hypothetical protein
VEQPVLRVCHIHINCMKLLLSISILFFCGLLRGAVIEYEAFLNGPSESPPNTSPGTGFAQVWFDDAANTLRVTVTFADLLGTTTASHIHAVTTVPLSGTAGVATVLPTFTGFPLGVTSGTYDHTFDLSLASSYNPAFVVAQGGTAASAEAALLGAMDAGRAYLNIHTTVVPGGEIRGFLVRVPEGGSVVLVWIPTLLSLFALAWHRRIAMARGN